MNHRLPRRFERYVAIGDSSTEGLIDPDDLGGYRGWSMRLAERIASNQGGLLYANLAIRGRTTQEIRDQQLTPALAMRPDLATVFSGTNDVVAWRFDAKAVARDMEHMQRAMIRNGATVLTFTLPDLTPVMPVARVLSWRIRAMNRGLRAACARTGAILLDFAAHPVATDPRLWNEDRIHANAAGHERIAAALAHALALPGSDECWKDPLSPLPAGTLRERAGAEARWVKRHMLPWLARGLWPRPPREAPAPRRPRLEALAPAGPR